MILDYLKLIGYFREFQLRIQCIETSNIQLVNKHVC
jgi:hypothetical protein